jgi:lipid-binding SYLF domain-containing protein
MKTLKSITFACFLLIAFVGSSQSKEDQRIINDAKKAKAMLIKTNAGIEGYFKNASGYAIFPNVGKGGLIVGGASGNGVVYENGVAIGMTELKKLNVGLQAGGQAITEVIFFETDAALQDFKMGNYEFSAELSAVALESGKALNANYNDGVVVYAMPKAGLMADASVGGQKFSFHPFK